MLLLNLLKLLEYFIVKYLIPIFSGYDDDKHPEDIHMTHLRLEVLLPNHKTISGIAAKGYLKHTHLRGDVL